MPLRRMRAAGVFGELLESGHAAVVEIAFGLILFELAFKIFWTVAFWLTETGGAGISHVSPVWLRLRCLVRILRSRCSTR